MTEHRSGVQPAELVWSPAGNPSSESFDDVYFLRTDGINQSRYIFLQHNQLPERFAALDATENSCFCIGEAGFGSGLNFLAAWQLWRASAPSGARLHFVSLEKYPLKREDLARLVALWPELNPLPEMLIEAYPPILESGVHRLVFDHGRIHLTLIFNDAAAGLTQFKASEHPEFTDRGAKIDAWFLDGFSPAKNPQMWSQELFEQIGKLSHRGTTLATFSAAGLVRQRLTAAGFEVSRPRGFGTKQQMVSARYNPSTLTPEENPAPWRKKRSRAPLPWDLIRNPPEPSERRVLVIGGGLAGCHSARALAERGYQITLLERQPQVAAEASGNPQGLLYAKLSPQNSALAAFNLASLIYAQNHYRQFWRASADFGSACGVLQLAYDEAEQAAQLQLKKRFGKAEELVRFVDAGQASDIAGVPLPHSGLYFPKAGWLDPRAICRALLEHPNIELRTGVEVDQIEYLDRQWLALDNQGRELAHAPLAVVSNARDAQRFAPSRNLPLKAIRGQVTYLAANSASEALQTALCAEGYLAPAHRGWHCLGASFNLKDSSPSPRLSDHQANLDKLEQQGSAVAALFNPLTPPALTGRVAFRCATRDYLPLVGPVPQEEQFLSDYAPLRKDAQAQIPLAGAYWPGLYVNLGHGSRGLAYTPLSAQLLAAQITGEPPPMNRELTRALNPARFLIRDLIRSKI